MLMVPALGVPSEELLQDTFKSILVSFGTLAAGLSFLWLRRDLSKKVIVHPLFALPAALSLYAVASMAWSHTFLAGVEAVRWFILTILLFVAANSLNQQTTRRLLFGIHLGITLASVWTALQFWADLSYFPQGPNPASTFVNRNFFAEYAVSVIPLSIYLLVTEKNIKAVNTIAFSLAFNVIALFMSGTRSALITLIFALVITAIILHRYWPYFQISQWSKLQQGTIAFIIILIILIMGLIPTTNKNLIKEFGLQTPISRAINRTASIAKSTEYSTGSFSVRSVMWKATIDMIWAHPLRGIGAGAWEVQAPLYQTAETQVEADFYAHNEFLQLIAEYGFVGWFFALSLGFYLIKSIYRTLTVKMRHSDMNCDVALRLFCTLSLLALLTVSNAGFPFRLASTGALFILSLALLVSSDMRIYESEGKSQYLLNLQRPAFTLLMLIFALSVVATTYISALAIKCESSLVRAVKLALTITNSGQPNNPQWDNTKEKILTLLEEGIAINPHYRKLTPMAADEMASWGDWRNAIWVWDSVLQSRPYVIALSANIAKGYLQLGDVKAAWTYLDRAAAVQATAPTVRSMQALLFAKEGNYFKSIPLIRALFKEGFYDYDLVYTAYSVGNKAHDLPLVVEALQLRLQTWPAEATDAWMKLGDIYSLTELRNDEKALFCYRMAIEANPAEKAQLLEKIPQNYRSKIQLK